MKGGDKMIVDKVPETAKYIENSVDHYVDIDGSVYCHDMRDGFNHDIWIKKAQTTCLGYKYCAILYDTDEGRKRISKRVHRLVAEAFIPNPDDYKVVGHKNNIKDDNRVDNLYWTTTSENTQKAYDDGLACNDKGYQDSQSKPVNMYDSKTNELLQGFGSISIAAKETGIKKGSISHMAKYHRPSRKYDVYFRFQK